MRIRPKGKWGLMTPSRKIISGVLTWNPSTKAPTICGCPGLPRGGASACFCFSTREFLARVEPSPLAAGSADFEFENAVFVLSPCDFLSL